MIIFQTQLSQGKKVEGDQGASLQGISELDVTCHGTAEQGNIDPIWTSQRIKEEGIFQLGSEIWGQGLLAFQWELTAERQDACYFRSPKCTLLNPREMQKKLYMRLAKIHKCENTRCWQGCEETDALIRRWRACEMAQLPWPCSSIWKEPTAHGGRGSEEQLGRKGKSEAGGRRMSMVSC